MTVDGIRLLPRPVQQPGIPLWAAGFPGKIRPMRRAARLDGYFPVNLTHPDQLAEAVAAVNNLREDPTRPYDFAVEFDPSWDPAGWEKAGATWLMVGFDPASMSLDRVRAVLRNGPPS